MTKEKTLKISTRKLRLLGKDQNQERYSAKARMEA